MPTDSMISIMIVYFILFFIILSTTIYFIFNALLHIDFHYLNLTLITIVMLHYCH